MDEGVTITVMYKFKPGAADPFCEIIPTLLLDTAKSDGFRDIKVLRNSNDPSLILLLETWDSEQHYKKYIAWRTERGDMDRTAEVLVEGRTELWPTFVAKA